MRLIRNLICMLFVVLLAPLASYSQNLKLYDLACEYLTNPIGIEVTQPRLSWKISADARNTTQEAYQLIVAGSPQDLKAEKALLWNSGKIKTSQSIHVNFAGSQLSSLQKCYWKVRIWDNHGHQSEWSNASSWQMGLLQPTDWKAKWIGELNLDTAAFRKPPIFRKEIVLKKEVKSAVANITSLGLYEAHINGQRIGDGYFTPGWTSYNKRLQYQMFDVTQLLQKGNNAIGALLGDGWFRGYLAWNGKRNFYGSDLALLMQLNVEYVDGTKETFGTDASWKSSTGAIISSDIYHGETFDARLIKNGWNKIDYKEDNTWQAVKLIQPIATKLVATISPLVKKHEEFKALKIITTPKGETVVDFGQNLAGWVKIKAQGKAGTRIILNHAEVLDKAGNFYTENLRTAKQQNEYVLSGRGLEEFEPHFTFQGFRYVKIEGYPGQLNLSNISAVALYSAMKTTGSFTSSNPLLNQLQSNIQWGQKGNFLDVPTDCPQRDERLGWTGDAQAFFTTAAYNMDVASFFTKWLSDLAADQHPSGNVPVVIPDFRKGKSGSAGWGDAATIIPYQLYKAYGDTAILRQQYNSMKSWTNFITKSSKNNLWNTGVHYGDWLFYTMADDRDGKAAITDKYLIAQVFYAHSVQNMINTAKILQLSADEAFYTKLLANIKKAFVNEYVTPSGRLVSNSQTAYVLALNFDMLPENLREQAATRLVQNIKDYGYHITTGFLGTPYICDVLSRFGHTDIAYKLLLQESYPSWLYPIKKGATTIWERWDGIKPDGSFQNVGMNSFNHYAYGAIGNWMYKNIAGINMDENATAYKRITFKPLIGGNISAAKAQLETLYGQVSMDWKLTDNAIEIKINIPANATASLLLPGIPQGTITEGGRDIQKDTKIKVNQEPSQKINLSLGSGNYQFNYQFKPKSI